MSVPCFRPAQLQAAGVLPTPEDQAVMDEKIGTALDIAEHVHDAQAGFIDQAAWALMSAAVQEQKDRLSRLQREAESKHRHVESHVLQDRLAAKAAMEQMIQRSFQMRESSSAHRTSSVG
ncbi:hypothetical protein WJX84_008816 [Apatococcus fuscideae]|uniref:Uncharacterized protein n=1 Tax=Apatococcus fuscideae TaxID=2026836 RepID=A0AAW1SL93_9CHLO